MVKHSRFAGPAPADAGNPGAVATANSADPTANSPQCRLTARRASVGVGRAVTKR